MRFNICLMMSIFYSLVVVALPQPSVNARSWKTYGVYKIDRPPPPFPPPNIGPLDLPNEFFKDYPDLTTTQIGRIKQKNTKVHKLHQKQIADKWHETGEKPSPEEVRKRAYEIRVTIREACEKEQEKARDPALEIKRVELRIQDKQRTLASQPDRDLEDRKTVAESDRILQEAAKTIDGHRKQIAGLLADNHRLKRQQQRYREESPEYMRIEQRVQQQAARLAEELDRRRQVELTASRARKRLGEAKARIKVRPSKIREIEADIKKLSDQLKDLKEANPYSVPNSKEDRTGDRKDFSLAALGKDAREWVQGVGGFLQDVNRRVSTKADEIRLGPFNAPVQPGLLSGVP